MRKSFKLHNKILRNKKSFIFLLILCLGVGFAFLSSQLTITGNTSVSGNKWSVYFNNIQVTDGSVDATVEPTTTGTTTTSIEYTVNLDKPGDFYEFTVDAVNAGTIDAMIASITTPTIDSRVLQYINYSTTYEDGTELAQNDVLAKDSTETYKVRVEYKKDIEATDLDEDGVNLTLTFGVNYIQSTIKSKSFVKIVKDNALSDSSINFKQISSDSNGKGLYVRTDTTEDTYPIYYYRGNVSNNNALFAGYCWKIVRTTETGGTKLIYNGSPSKTYKNVERISNSSYINVENDETYPYTFNETNQEWVNDNDTNFNEVTFIFSVKEAGDYILNYNMISSESDWGDAYILMDDEVIESVYASKESKIYLNNLKPSNVIKIVYRIFNNVKISIDKGVGTSSIGCTNMGASTQIGESFYNDNYTSPAFSGYMYGTVYERGINTTSTSDLYGNSFTYSNGTYTLSDTHSGPDSTHHYTCFNTTDTCANIYYVYFLNNSTTAYYITLENGKSVEDAIEEMQENKTDSTIKTVIDNWFSDSFITYFTKKGKDYNNYLEDTIWCDDRSFNELGTYYINSGWIPNGGDLNKGLFYSAYGRRNEGLPTLTCSNKNDSFTVEESAIGNGKLTYPVGLLTADEMIFAGGSGTNNNSNYLYNNQEWWFMTALSFYYENAIAFRVDSVGTLDGYNVKNNLGVRPSISLKSSVKVREGGDGTAVTPYQFVVE